VRQGRAADGDGRAHVERDLGVERLDGDVVDALGAGDTRRVDEHVEAPVHRHVLVDGRDGGQRVGEVDGDRMGIRDTRARGRT
jgi:hypothetical protein